jgi:hypothetical protein
LTTADQLTPVFKLSDGPPAFSIPARSQLTGSIANGSSVNYYPPDAPISYTQQWHFSIQHQFPGEIVLETAYVGNKGTHLRFVRDLNQVPLSLLGPGDAQSRRPYPQYQTVNSELRDANSDFQSLQLTLRKTFSHGITVLSNYTLSKSIDNSSVGNMGAGGTDYQIAARPDLNRALSEFDVPQRFVGTVIYELPFGSGRAFLNRKGIANFLFGGWRASNIFKGQSGVPFSVLMAGANLSGSLAGTWFPDRIANGGLPGDQRSIRRWFDASAFAVPARFTFGNSGRNILRGPGFQADDFALAKDFPFHTRFSEAGKIGFRADFQNAFNHPSFGQPGNAFGSAAIGTITTASAPRAIQLELHVAF